MKKTLLSMAFAIGMGLSAGQASAVTPDYQDWWLNSAQSGMGVNIGQQMNTLVVAWYMYDADGKPAYLMLSGDLQGNRLSGDLFRMTGPLPGAEYDPSKVVRTPVGKAELEFRSLREAVLTYNYDGRSGSLALERFVFDAPAEASSALMFGAVEDGNCKDSLFAGQKDRMMKVNLIKNANQSYDLSFGHQHGGYDFLQCTAKGMALTLDKGVWKGSANIDCQVYAHYSDIFLGVMPPPTTAQGTLQISALRLNGNNSFFAWSADIKPGTASSCSAKGVFRGFSVTIDD